MDASPGARPEIDGSLSATDGAPGPELDSGPEPPDSSREEAGIAFDSGPACPEVRHVITGRQQTRDTMIQQANPSAAASAIELTVSGEMNAERRILIRFELEAGVLPAGTLVRAELALYLAAGTTSSTDLAIHRVSDQPPRDWIEGATWLRYDQGTNLWSTPGGDYAPVASAQVTAAAGRSPGDTIRIPVTDDVLTFIQAPAKNFGWMIRSQGSAPGPVEFRSSESASQANCPTASCPRLELVFCPPG